MVLTSKSDVDHLTEKASLKSRASAKMAAVISSALGQTGPFISDLIEQFKMYRDSDTEKVVAATLTLGETGALNDVSAVPGITEEVSSMFTHQHEQVRRAAAICLGCICSGNTEFFVEKVFQRI